jgi:hypothetical protein
MEQRMKEPYRKGIANHPGPESCEGRREAALEALTGAYRRWLHNAPTSNSIQDAEEILLEFCTQSRNLCSSAAVSVIQLQNEMLTWKTSQLGFPLERPVVITEIWQDRHRSVQNSHTLKWAEIGRLVQ